MKFILRGQAGRLAETAQDLLFPPRCPLCDEPAGVGRRGFCPACGKSLHPIGGMGCAKCGKALEEKERYICNQCSGAQHFFTEGRSLYVYPEIAPAIYRFKYGGRKSYAQAFAYEICTALGDTIRGWGANAIVPVPLHRKRYRKRGYNQAALLAREIGKKMNIPVCENLVGRCRDTVPQKRLNASQRQNNLKRAFKMLRNDVKLDTIIIVDDIYTTGCTVDEMAKVLLEGGVKRAYVLTLASGSG